MGQNVGKRRPLCHTRFPRLAGLRSARKVDRRCKPAWVCAILAAMALRIPCANHGKPLDAPADPQPVTAGDPERQLVCPSCGRSTPLAQLPPGVASVPVGPEVSGSVEASGSALKSPAAGEETGEAPRVSVTVTQVEGIC
jgi:hypothetical protein